MFLGTSDEQYEKEAKKTIPLIAASQRIKYSGVNRRKAVRNVCSENHKMLSKRPEKTRVNAETSRFITKRSTDPVRSLSKSQVAFFLKLAD